jgi:hypothetical protein
MTKDLLIFTFRGFDNQKWYIVLASCSSNA